MINRLGASLDFQGQALLLRSQRQQLLAGNIANADTPGYVARDMDFAAALRQATAPLAGSTTAGSAGVPRFGAASTTGLAEQHLRYATPSQSNLDGNSVDMDRERASYADNTIKYEATLRFINGSVRTLLDAMKGHHQA